MSNKKTAASTTSTTEKKNSSKQIIAEPVDIVNMSSQEIISAAILRLEKEEKEASYDRFGKAVHKAVRSALCEFCRQNAEFAQAICQSDKHFSDCVKAVTKNCGTSLSDFDAYSRAVRFYFAGASISFKMLIDVGDGVLNEVPAEPEQNIELALDTLMDW